MIDVSSLSREEMLELAAEATGIKVYLENTGRPWDPLYTSLDAFWLLGSLRMSLNVDLKEGYVTVSHPETGPVMLAESQGVIRTLCLAITRCAALVALERRKQK